MTALDPTTLTQTALTREALAAAGTPMPPAPVRIVHLGLGAFHRAHQAWYTARASDAAEWGIAAYTGRRPDVADALAPQDGVYTLVERAEDRDSFELVGSIVKVVDGDDVADFVQTLSDPAVVVLTLTVTEAGYRLDAAGLPDVADPMVAADLVLLRAAFSSPELPLAAVRTALGRVLLGLEARRRRGAPPLAIVSCDNIPDNGRLVERALGALAAQVSVELAEWLPKGASFVATSVDRITPSTTLADIREVAMHTGWSDAAPTITEPFSDWVLSGDFPSGRPRWESAGARFVDDIEPWEARKLWLLNGAHTLLANRGALFGHTHRRRGHRRPGLSHSCRGLLGRGLGTSAGPRSRELSRRTAPPILERTHRAPAQSDRPGHDDQAAPAHRPGGGRRARGRPRSARLRCGVRGMLRGRFTRCGWRRTRRCRAPLRHRRAPCRQCRILPSR